MTKLPLHCDLQLPDPYTFRVLAAGNAATALICEAARHHRQGARELLQPDGVFVGFGRGCNTHDPWFAAL